MEAERKEFTPNDRNSQQGIIPGPISHEEFLRLNDGGPLWNIGDVRRFYFEGYLGKLSWDNTSANNNKTYWAFLRAVSLGIAQQVAYDLVVQRITRAGGHVDSSGIARQWRRACEYLGKVAAGEIIAGPKVRAAEFSPELLKHVASRIVVLDPVDFLRQRSAVPPATVTAESFLEHLYHPGERVIVFSEFKSQGQALYVVGETTELSIPKAGADGIWYLVQPVDGQEHHNPRQGKLSRRSEESVTRWPYLVLESDKADTGDWLRLLLQLPLAIVAIYTSGGRSIHALVRVDAADKTEWDNIKAKVAAVLVPLGADRGALSAVRLSRLPQCWRGERLQELLYLNPAADGTPIHGLNDNEDGANEH